MAFAPFPFVKDGQKLCFQKENTNATDTKTLKPISQQTGLFHASLFFFLLHFPIFFRQTFQYSVFNKVPTFSISIPLHKYIMKDATLIHTTQKPKNIHSVIRKEK